MASASSVYNIRLYAETPLIARILRDAMIKDEAGFEDKTIDVCTHPNATDIQKYKGLTYLDIKAVGPLQMARLVQNYSGVVGLTTVTRSGNGIHEMDVTAAMKQARLIVGAAHPARYPAAHS